MPELYLNIKRKRIIFAIQFAEMILVILFLLTSFATAGLLIYNEIFPFGVLNGVLLFSMASGVAVILLSTNKFFSFLNPLSAVSIVKFIWIVFLLNFTLIILLYFNSPDRLSFYYFIVAGTIQYLSLFFIKLVSGRTKRIIIKDRNSLVIGRNIERNNFLDALEKEGLEKIVFISERSGRIREYMDRADNIYLMTSKPDLKHLVIAYCEQNNKKLFIVPEAHEIAMRDSEMIQIGDIPLFAIEGFQLSESQAIIKRFADIVISIIAIILTLPLIATVAIFIKLEDGGPVFYRQIRSGLYGKEFVLIKLRSMVTDAESHTGPVLAKEKDPRVTRVGRMLRSARIDELPQFFNVLCGSMSVVGPRPERPVFVQRYEKEYPEYTHRLVVKPGITGLAQVLANYGTTAENKLKFDLVYIKRFSIVFDLYIILKTLKVVFSRKQADGISEGEEGPVDGQYDDDTTIENILNFGKRIPAQWQRRHCLKIAAITVACLLIVFSSVLLRYSSIISTITISINEYSAAETILASGEEILYITDSAGEISEDSTTREIVLGYRSTGSVKSMGKKEILQQAYLIIKNLSVEDMMFIEKLVKDGLSRNEKRMIVDIINKQFNEEEIVKLLAISPINTEQNKN